MHYMRSEELISIIVPIYRTEKYLKKCIESIQAQLYRNIEIILIDDGSPDECGNICDQFAKQDKRIRVYHIDNSGLSSARNYGIQRAHGEWIGFVDSDDWIEPNMYKNLYRNAIQYAADISTCGCYLEYRNKTVLEKQDFTTRLYSTIIDLGKGYYEDKIIGNYAWNKLYKRDVFNKVMFPEGKYFEDWYITTRHIRIGYKTVSSTEPLYHYRQRINSIVRTTSLSIAIDRWEARVDRFDLLSAILSEYHQLMITDCLFSVCQAYACAFRQHEKAVFSEQFINMLSFVRFNFREVMTGDYSRTSRFLSMIEIANNRFVYMLAFIADKLYHIFYSRERKQKAELWEE